MVDGGIGLDRVDEVIVGGQRLDRAVDGRDDPDGERVLVAEGAADRSHGFADADQARVAERQRRQRVIARIDLDQADVVEDVPADDPRLDAVAVGELHIEICRRLGSRSGSALADVSDDVGVGEDVALPRHDEAGPLRGLGLRTAEERVDGDDTRRAERVDPSGIEAVPDQRLHRGYGRRRGGRGWVYLAENDSLRAGMADPACGTPDSQDSEAAEDTGEKDCHETAAHLGPL